MTKFVRVSLLSFTLISMIVAAAPAGARSDFDGNWSVAIRTERGACDPGYRFEVRVENGKITYRGAEPVDLSGNVQPNGLVRVNVRNDVQFATVAGRLARDRGTGTWQGKLSSGDCTGTWKAERR
jgi:hypothetical protein